jgi:cell division protein FtsQ
MSTGTTGRGVAIPRRRWATALTALLVVTAAMLAVGANAWKRELRVTRIRAEGNRILTEREIMNIAGIPKNELLFALDLNAIRQRIEQHPSVRSASVNRDAPDGITITIDERVPVAAIALDRVLYIDAEGVVLPPGAAGEAPDLPVITGDLPAGTCIPGKRVTAENVQEALEILTTARMIGDDLYHLISEVHLDRGKDIVLITAEAGVPIAFGHGNAAMKLLTLDGFWKQVVGERGATDLRTVDIRFADQVVARWQNDSDVAAQ